MKSHRDKILELIGKEEVVSVSEVARVLKISWNTAEKYLLMLAIEGKVRMKKKENGTLWMRK